MLLLLDVASHVTGFDQSESALTNLVLKEWILFMKAMDDLYSKHRSLGSEATTLPYQTSLFCLSV